MNGAEALVKALKLEGVKAIFGISGGAALPIYDALSKQDSIVNVLNRHEQGSVHMAEGYARVSGKVGVCLATSGPGATNLITGLADALLDSVPVLAITAQVPTSVIGTDAFQESDIIGISMPVVKHSVQVRRAEDIPRLVRELMHIARTGRPGPVLLDIPRDVSMAEVEEFHYPTEVQLRGYHPHHALPQDACEEAARMIQHARRPLLYVGGGIASGKAEEALLQVAEKGDIPVVTTLMGRCAFPSVHPLSLNMLGMHGTVYANWAVRDCDLLIAVGVRFDDRVTGNLKKFATKPKVIHIEVDPAEVHKNRRADLPILASSRMALEAIAAALEPCQHDAWRRQTAAWKEAHPLSYTKGDLLKPQYIMEEIARLTRGDAILATDVGQHQMWAAQYYPFKRPQQWITSGGLGTMGFGLPAALGAKFARPEDTVWLVTGDGSFQMNIQELAVSTVYQLPIKIALFNNASLGMVKQWQTMFYEERYNGSLLHTIPDFEALAKAYQCEGITVKTAEEVRPALERAMAIHDKTVLIDFQHDPQEQVYPMIASGNSVDEMVLQPREEG